MGTNSIQTNMSAITAQRSLTFNQSGLATSLERLSTGFRINSAKDDAAGLAVSESLKAQIRGLNQAQRNANDGLSVVNTAEGALDECSNILVRMRELATQAASDGIGDTERGYLQLEFDALRTELDRIATTTEFNGSKLLDGSLSVTGLDFHVGLNATAQDRITLNINTMDPDTLGVTTAVGVGTKAEAQAMMSVADSALQSLNGERAALGAFANRLTSTIENLSVAHENLSAANSRIRDTDIAKESAEMVRQQVLVQASTAMLSQANQVPFQLTQLLQG